MRPELDLIIEYESGDLGREETLELFQHLVDTGKAWILQGSYGRTAKALLDAGVISPWHNKGGRGVQTS